MLSFIWNAILGRFILLITFLNSIVFVSCSINPFLNLDALLGAGFLGILFPYALMAMGGCFILCLILKPRWSIVVLIILLLNWKQIFICISPHWQKQDFEIIKNNNKNSLRVLNWNVRRCLPDGKTNIYERNFSNHHQELLTTYNADVLCLQEFVINETKLLDPNEAINVLKKMGYQYYFFSKDYAIDDKLMSGNIVLSKHKIINKNVTHFEQIEAGSESMMYVDIETPLHRSVRLFTTHLESYGFKNEEYQKIELIKKRKDKNLEASRDIFFKMRNSFLLRKQQADIIKSYLTSTPLPYILTGDFNDVPNSYTYYTLSENMNDAFVEKGFFIARTYTHLLPTLRIDYIFSSKNFNVQQFQTIKTNLSDHYPIVADLEIKK